MGICKARHYHIWCYLVSFKYCREKYLKSPWAVRWRASGDILILQFVWNSIPPTHNNAILCDGGWFAPCCMTWVVVVAHAYHSRDSVPGAEDGEWSFFLVQLSWKQEQYSPQTASLFFSSLIMVRSLAAGSWCMLGASVIYPTLGSEEQECSRARSPQREVCGGPAKCCNASKRLTGRVYSTFTAYTDKRAVSMWPCSTWIGGRVHIVHAAILLMLLLLLNPAFFHASFISLMCFWLAAKLEVLKRDLFLCDPFPRLPPIRSFVLALFSGGLIIKTVMTCLFCKAPYKTDLRK